MTGATHAQPFFMGKDASVQELYDLLLARLRDFGPVKEEGKKTSIHLVNSSAFAGVQVRRSWLLPNIKSERPIESPRIRKSEQVSAGRFHNEARISSPADLDQELLGWLEKAYRISA